MTLPSGGKKAFAEVVPDSHGRWAVQIEGVHYLVGQSYKNKEEAKEHAGEINKAVSAAVREALLDHINVIEFGEAPCYICGYNGAGYYQPASHPCAVAYHKKVSQEKPR